MENAKILIVEDEKIVARDIENRLKSFGYVVVAVVSTGEAAIQKAAEIRPDLVLMDILLKGNMDGVTAAEQIHDRFDIPIIYLTAFADDKTLQRAKITEPYGYIIKPFEERELRITIEIALYRHKMERRFRESEKRYKDLFDSTVDGVYRVDAGGVFVLANRACAEIFGHGSSDDLIGRSDKEYWVDSQERDAFKAELKTRRSVSAYPIRVRRPDGTIIYLETSSHVMEDSNGNIIGVEGIFRDVTERKEIEKALAEEKKISDAVIENLPGIFYLFDEYGKFLKWNRNLEQVTGYSSEEISRMAPLEFFIGEDRRIEEEHIQSVFQRGKTTSEATLVTKDGRRILFFFTCDMIMIGASKCAIGVGLDITERKKIEEQIFLISHDWQDTFDSITDMITVHDKDFNIVHANKAAEKILGLPFLEKTPDAKCFRYYHGTGKPPQGCPSCDCLQTGIPASFELFEPYLNMFVEIRAIPRFDTNNQLIGLIHIVRDISERKKAEDKLNLLFEEISKAKMEWEMTFDSAMEIIVLIDKELNIIRCNKSCSDFCGRPLNTIPGQKFYDLFPWNSEDLGYYKEKIQNEEPTEWIETKTTTGKWFYLSHRPIADKKGTFLYSIIIATDITGLKSAQEKIQESEEALKGRVKELEKFYEMAVGRELKMKELKKEIAGLKAELENMRK